MTDTPVGWVYEEAAHKNTRGQLCGWTQKISLEYPVKQHMADWFRNVRVVYTKSSQEKVHD